MQTDVKGINLGPGTGPAAGKQSNSYRPSGDTNIPKFVMFWPYSLILPCYTVSDAARPVQLYLGNLIRHFIFLHNDESSIFRLTSHTFREITQSEKREGTLAYPDVGLPGSLRVSAKVRLIRTRRTLPDNKEQKGDSTQKN